MTTYIIKEGITMPSNNITMPSLSKDGWVKSPVRTADYLFSHLFLAEYSQSYLFSGSITSLPYILAMYETDPSGYTAELEKSLNKYFSKYFDNVEITSDIISSDSRNVEVALYLSFTSDGVVYNLSKVVHYLDSKVAKIMDSSNS